MEVGLLKLAYCNVFAWYILDILVHQSTRKVEWKVSSSKFKRNLLKIYTIRTNVLMPVKLVISRYSSFLSFPFFPPFFPVNYSGQAIEEFLETNWFCAHTTPWIPCRFIRNEPWEIFRWREKEEEEEEEERKGSKVLGRGGEGILTFDAILPIDNGWSNNSRVNEITRYRESSFRGTMVSPLRDKSKRFAVRRTVQTIKEGVNNNFSRVIFPHRFIPEIIIFQRDLIRWVVAPGDDRSILEWGGRRIDCREN